MSDRPRPVSRTRTLALTGLMGLLLVAALTLPGPARAPAEAEPGVDAAPVEAIEVPPEFEDRPVEELPPAPAAPEEGDVRDRPVFTPYEVAPKLVNGTEVEAALTREYPPLLRDAGIGGQVMVFFFIDEQGRVQDVRVDESSGHQSLDEAAVTVAEIMEFAPAQNRDRAVPVWISLPITFQVR